VDDALIDPVRARLNYWPMDREIAQLNFEGKLQRWPRSGRACAADMAFGPWTATVHMGCGCLARRETAGQCDPGPCAGGAAGPTSSCDRPSRHRGLPSHGDVQGTSIASFIPRGRGHVRRWKIQVKRIWNGDQTDYGLNFTHLPQCYGDLATF